MARCALLGLCLAWAVGAVRDLTNSDAQALGSECKAAEQARAASAGFHDPLQVQELTSKLHTLEARVAALEERVTVQDSWKEV